LQGRDVRSALENPLLGQKRKLLTTPSAVNDEYRGSARRVIDTRRLTSCACRGRPTIEGELPAKIIDGISRRMMDCFGEGPQPDFGQKVAEKFSPMTFILA
jgi:hypothetical protein